MPKPKTKQALLAEIESEYQALEDFLANLSPAQMTRPGLLGDWSVKDVLAHLFEWQQMFFGWYQAGLRGATPHTPAEGYNWSQLPALNHSIYERYRHHELEDIRQHFRDSHQKTLQLTKTLSEEDLFTPGRYPWTRNNNLAAYINANTGSHYRWARGELRKGLRVKDKKD